MRITTVTPPGSLQPAVCVERAGTLIVIDAIPSMVALLGDPQWRALAKHADGDSFEADDPAVAWHAAVLPTKTICVGLNYRAHIQETGRETPRHPTLFGKFSDALAGPFDALTIPPETAKADWEVELGVVIGTAGRRIPETDALDHVAGFVVVNDISMRDWQNRTTQWMQGKNFDRSTPVGPWIVTPDELPPDLDLAISCEVSGVVMQSSRTSDLLFSVPELVAYISTFCTLRPGDLIATGTPGGIGNTRTPPRFLRSGDTLVSSIEGLGMQRNAIT